jgi:hypothetical protein
MPGGVYVTSGSLNRKNSEFTYTLQNVLDTYLVKCFYQINVIFGDLSIKKQEQPPVLGGVFVHYTLLGVQIAQYQLFPTRLHAHQRMNANGTSTK